MNEIENNIAILEDHDLGCWGAQKLPNQPGTCEDKYRIKFLFFKHTLN